MYGVSDAFRAAVRTSHTVGIRAEVWDPDTKVADLAVLDGSVDVDGRRSVRRTLSMTVAIDSDTVVPDSPGSPLAPYGNEVRVWRSVNGEEVPLGVFLITNVEVSTGADGTVVTVNGSDRSLRIQRARWVDPYLIRAVPTETAIRSLLRDRWFDVTVSTYSTGFTATKVTFGLDAGADPWADAQKLAASAGADLYFDVSGVATLSPVSDYLSNGTVATYLEDEEAVLLDLRRSLTSEQTYNGVIASGEGTGNAPVRAEAWDEDAGSPTYRYGKFGEVPMFYSSPLLETARQAEAAAARRLVKVQGLVEAIQWSQVCDPSLDANDLVAVYNAATKVERVLLLDRLTIPLRADAPMSAVARTIRTGLA